jgi:cytochrome c oxidase subunit III
VSTRREATPASVPAVRRGDALDVADLPTYGFSHRSLMWWGTAGMIAIEGVAFAFMIVVYFYLRAVADTWPAAGGPPGLLWGTLNLGIILASTLPNVYTDKAAIDHDLRKVRIGLTLCSIFGLVLCAVRTLEFTTLNVRWDDSAYGSAVWMLLGLHTFNLVTDVADTLVLTVLMFKGPLEGKRFVDVAENSGYWDFIVLSWVPIYAVLYWGARF